MDQLRNRAGKFMQLEELRDYHKNARVDTGGEKGKDKDHNGRYVLGRYDIFRENRGPQFHTYTLLNSNWDKKIMDKMLNVDLIPTLKKLQSLRDVDMSKQCRYDCNFGHTTEECQFHIFVQIICMSLQRSPPC